MRRCLLLISTHEANQYTYEASAQSQCKLSAMDLLMRTGLADLAHQAQCDTRFKKL